MSHVWVNGVGMTDFRRSSRNTLEHAEEAAREAIADAGLRPGDVDGLYFANFLGRVFDRQAVLGTMLARRLGLGPLPVVNVEGACASGGTAFAEGVTSVRAGRARHVLCVGSESMTPAGTEAVSAGLMHAADMSREGAVGLTFAGVFGMLAHAYLQKYGGDRLELSAVAVKNRAHATLNPRAIHRRPTSMRDVEESRPIADPLRLLDCSPVTDGAAAVVVSSAPRDSSPRVLATGQASGTVSVADMLDLTSFEATRVAAARAYEESGLAPSDVDVAEVHDCFSISELIGLGDLGLVAPGEAGRSTLRGLTRADTPGLVVNPSGGLLSRGHPIGATGLAQVCEIVEQLRGSRRTLSRRPRIGLSHNLGGAGAVCTVALLEAS